MNYLFIKEGKTNIVISAPHSGSAKPWNIPNRKYGNLLQDTYTKKLIQLVVKKLFWMEPYYIYSNIHRCKVDLNRDILEGAQFNTKAERIWKDWNMLIKYFTEQACEYGGKCLYIELHSHNDSNEIQLGYNLNARNYLKLMKIKRSNVSTTLDAIHPDPYETIFGDFSFKTSLENFGYKVFSPSNGKVYFNGGRGIETFSNSNVGAIQIEFPVLELGRNTDIAASAIYKAILNFKGMFLS